MALASIAHDIDLARERAHLRVVQLDRVEACGISGVASQRAGQREGDGVIGEGGVGWFLVPVELGHAARAMHGDLPDLIRLEVDFALPAFDGIDRRMRGDMAGIPLEAEFQSFEILAQSIRQFR